MIIYIRSGNVIFEALDKDTKMVRDILEEGINTALGYEVKVILRSVEEFQQILIKNPFSEDKATYITFLEDKATKENLEVVASYEKEDEKILIGDKEIYIYCPKGYGRAFYSNTFFEKKLKLSATTRNLNTVIKLISLADEE